MSRTTNTESSFEGTGKEEVIYTSRFSPAEEEARTITWKVLCEYFFQQFVSLNSTVLDIGAGDGHFLLNIRARKKIAVDLSPHVLMLKSHGIEVHQIPASQLAEYGVKDVDIVFMSNFLEHLPDKRLVLEVLAAAKQALKKDGRIIILQPNIRFVGVKYWDYIDHHIALTEVSLVEALEVSGFKIERLEPRFLPYTAKSRLGHAIRGDSQSWILKLYLKLPILWRIFGQQTLVIAKPQ